MDDLFSIDLAKWQTLETAFKSVFLKFNAGEKYFSKADVAELVQKKFNFKKTLKY